MTNLHGDIASPRERGDARERTAPITEPREKLGIQSAEVAAEVLGALTRLGRPVQLRDLAREAGMPSAKVHRYLVSLVRSNLVAQDPASGRYMIGFQSIAMGLTGLRSLDVVRIAGAALADLRQRTGETAILAIWTDAGPIVVQFDEADRPVYMNVKVGSILPLSRTATGLAFAAHLPLEVVSPLIDAHPAHRLSASDRPAFERRLKQSRSDGLASVHGDLVTGISAVAAPVFDHNGKVAAVIGVIGRQEDVTAALPKVIGPAIKAISVELTVKIGGLPFSG